MEETIEECENLMLVWESLNYLPDSTSPIQIRVFIGWFDSIQLTPFKGAVFGQNFDQNKVTLNYISVSDVKKLHWSPSLVARMSHSFYFVSRSFVLFTISQQEDSPFTTTYRYFLKVERYRKNEIEEFIKEFKQLTNN
jgi:hypothetical protein